MKGHGSLSPDQPVLLPQRITRRPPPRLRDLQAGREVPGSIPSVHSKTVCLFLLYKTRFDRRKLTCSRKVASSIPGFP